MDESGKVIHEHEMQIDIDIVDLRGEKDAPQQLALSERLKSDKVSEALTRAHEFIGEYAGNRPEDLSIEIVDGNLGEGTIKGKVIELQLSEKEKSITDIREFVEAQLPDIPEDKKNKRAEEIAIALTASTTLHEGVHGLLDSKPDSKFAFDFESVSGFPNEEGKASTLLDEGIAYAIQGIYAPDVETIGSLAPIAKEIDERLVKQRKLLGEKLRPTVKEYIDGNKSIDSDFFEKAKEAMINTEDIGVVEKENLHIEMRPESINKDTVNHIENILTPEAIKTGEQTIITPKIQEVADNISGEGETLIKNISDYIKLMEVIQGSKEPNFRRTADEIINNHKYDGCNEVGVVFVALLRAKGKPATYIEALNKKALENYSHQNPNLVAHIFIETEIDGQKRFVNSTTGEITDLIPATHIEAARGLDSWEIGLKEGFADLQRLFEEKHGMKELKVISQEK